MLHNKTTIITGANAGLGFETSLALAKRGAEVIMICRSEEKAKRARDAVIKQSGNESVYVELADLAVQNDVRAVADKIRSKHSKIDVLVNNAGLVMSQHRLTPDEIETTFAVNHIAPFLLTKLLLPMIGESDHARIVNVSSNNHYKAEMKFHDIHHERNFSGIKAYGQSKLANILFTYELDRRLKEKGLHHINVNALDPGLINTDIGNKSTNWLYSIAWHIRKRQGVSPEEGAKTQIHLASSEELKGISGKYWRRSKDVTSSKASYNTQHAEQLWELSEEMCGIDSYID